MLKMFKNKKAQNTAEYAILIALVVGGIVAMQTYAQRTMQGRLRDANRMFTDSTNEIGSTAQYEPYYTCTTAENDRITTEEDTYQGQTVNTIASKKQGSYVDDATYNGVVGY